MRPIDLLNAMDGLDEQTVADAEQGRAARPWRKWCGAAACLCLILAGVWTLGPEPLPPPVEHDGSTVQTAEPPADLLPSDLPPWEAVYNRSEPGLTMDVMRVFHPGFFTEALSGEELAAVAPSYRLEWSPWTGEAGFDEEGNLLGLWLFAGRPGQDIRATLSTGRQLGCGLRPGDEDVTVSRCGTTEYRLYEALSGQTTALRADAQLNGVYLTVTLEVPAEETDRAREDFQRALECFSTYGVGLPDLSRVTAEEIPEWLYEARTHEQALQDPEFGRYFPGELPTGFEPASIIRWKNQRENILDGCWFNGMAQLEWTVEPMRPEDEARLVHPEEREKYDLSLYPVPRAESVPEDLRTVVDDPVFPLEELSLDMVRARSYSVEESGDVSGPRFRFSVTLDGVRVNVSGKGVSPEWIFEALTGLQKN